MEKKNKKLCLVVIMVFILVGASYVFGSEPVLRLENCATPFNMSEIIEHVTHHPIMEGNTIVIKDRVYEAFFNEHGIILKARETKQDAEDLIIPVTGRPEIQDGKVVYQTEYGEITFAGTSKNLPSDPNRIAAEISKNLSFMWSREGEFVIDTTCTILPQAQHQIMPAVAFDGSNYLVVWMDCRNNRHDIYGSRVDQFGTILDPGGIAINVTDQAADFVPVSIAFDGTNYLVVWINTDFSSICGVRIDQSGHVLDTTALTIATAPGWYLDSPNVTFGDSNYIVVWYTWNDLNVYGVRVSPSGAVLDTSWIPISNTEFALYPSVAFNGTDFFVVWQGLGGSVYGVRVDQNGVLIDTAEITISTEPNDCWYFSVASDNSNIFVVWADRRNGAESDIYGARVDQSGVVLDTSGIAICTTTRRQGDPHITFDGDKYLVAWRDQSSDIGNIYCARVNQTGTVLDTLGIAISTITGPQLNPAVAYDGSNFLVVWRSHYDADIFATRVDQSGTVLDTAGICVSIGVTYYEQMSPSVAFDGINYLVVWEDYLSGSDCDVYGARVDQSGIIVDSSPIVISTAINSQRYPSVAFDGSNYLVVWRDARNSVSYPDIYGARVDQTGTVLDPSGIAISTAALSQWFPSVAFDGTNYFIVWQDSRNSGPYYDGDIYGARVTTSGNVLDPTGIPIAVATGYQEHPAIVFGGDNYLVTWDDTRGPGINIRGTRVDQTGSVLDTAGIVITVDSAWQWHSSVTFDGINYLTVWQDNRPGNYQDDIYCARISQSGTVLDPNGNPISCALDRQTHPSICFDGNDYMVIWQDYRSTNTYNIYGATVDTSGVVIDSHRISFQPGHQVSPALAHGTGSQILAVYSGWTDSISGHPADVMHIWGHLSPFPGIEERSAQPQPSSQNLLHVYPNPTYRQCNLQYTLFKPTNVCITIYDVTGRVTKKIVNCEQHAGSYQQRIDISNLAQGVYFIRLETNKGSETKKVIYLK